MKPCPNCSSPVAPNVALCPHCGADTRALWQADGLQTEGVPNLGLRRRADKWHFAGGFFLTLLLSCGLPVFMLGSLISGVIYYVSRHKNPVFATGAGWGTLAGIFGAITVCIRIIGGPH